MLRRVVALGLVLLVLGASGPVVAGPVPWDPVKSGMLAEIVYGKIRTTLGPVAWRTITPGGTFGIAFRFVGIPFIAYLTYAAFEAAFNAWRAGLAEQAYGPPAQPGNWSRTWVNAQGQTRSVTITRAFTPPYCGSAPWITVSWLHASNFNYQGQDYYGSNMWCGDASWSAVLAFTAALLAHLQAPPGVAKYPGTEVTVATTLAGAQAQPEFVNPTVPSDLNEGIINRIKTLGGNPPMSEAAWNNAGVSFAPSPNPYMTGPEPQPSPGPVPTPGPLPSPGAPPGENPPEEEVPGDPVTQSYMRALINWLGAMIQASIAWLADAMSAMFQWLAQEVGRLVEWSVAKTAEQINWAVGEVRSLVGEVLADVGARLDVLAEKLDAVLAAIQALPVQITEGMAEAVRAGAEAAFKPQAETLAAWSELQAVMMTKPPFSLLPPASMFPSPSGSCTLPQIPSWTLHAGAGQSGVVNFTWPAFVCEFAGWLRTFFLGLFYLSMGWWAIQRLLPQVTMS